MHNLKEMYRKLSPKGKRGMESGRSRRESFDSTAPKSPESGKSTAAVPWMGPLEERNSIPEIHIDRYEFDVEKRASSMADLMSRSSIREAGSEYPWMAGRSASSLGTGLAPSLKESAQEFVEDMRMQEGLRRRAREQDTAAEDDPENEGQWLSGADISPKLAKRSPARAKGKEKGVSKKSYVDLKLETGGSSKATSLRSDAPSAPTSPGLTEFSSSGHADAEAAAAPIDLFTPEEWVRFINMRKLYAVSMIMSQAVASILTFKADLPASYESFMEDAQKASAKLLTLIEAAELRKKFQGQSCDPVARAVLDVERTGGSLERLAHRLERWLECDINEGVNV